jgi:subtilisin family serine protease
MTRSSLLALVLLLAGAGGVEAGTQTRVIPHPDPVADHYIVTLSASVAGPQGPSVAEAAQSLAAEYGGQVTFVYQHALQGFAVRLSEEKAESLAKDGRVATVEQDARADLSGVQSPATWGLDRVDQRYLPLNNTYHYPYTGAGVHVYIVDSGIRGTHQEFTGRMGNGVGFIDDGNGTNDCNGHGTHVAGTVGGTTYGVAKGATLHPVRIVDCGGNGTAATIIAGVDWITGNRVNPAVANMSLRLLPGVTALDNAVENSVASGVVYAVAAGNDFGNNACDASPARAASALTVGFTTRTDARSSLSNTGPCLDLFAPGFEITSAWNTSDSATRTISGTSMASPHVAGIAALYRQQDPTASASQVSQAVIDNATTGIVSDPGPGSPNRLAHSIFPGTGPRISIGDVWFAEGPAGIARPRVAVSLSAASPVDVTVHYETADCTAHAGSDYQPFSGDLRFVPGELTKHILVNAIADFDFEASETYLVNLSAPVDATLGDGRGQVTLVNDDPDPAPPLGLPPADFDGDGKTDILWRHQGSGQLSAWFMDGINRTGGSFLDPSAESDLQWKLVGTGDFNGDAKMDVLWAHDHSGGSRVWLMDGITRVGEVALPSQISRGWRVAGTGDFNGDGKTDILWREDGAGNLMAWLMDGTTVISRPSLDPGSVADLDWRIVGTGDFNHDGKTDILWRHQVSTQLVAWLMDGVILNQGVFLTPSQPADASWQMSAVGDFNGDRRSDLLWRHQQSGELVAWLMNGTTLACGVFLNPDRLTDMAWQVVGPR